MSCNTTNYITPLNKAPAVRPRVQLHTGRMSSVNLINGDNCVEEIRRITQETTALVLSRDGHARLIRRRRRPRPGKHQETRGAPTCAERREDRARRRGLWEISCTTVRLLGRVRSL